MSRCRTKSGIEPIDLRAGRSALYTPPILQTFSQKGRPGSGGGPFAAEIHFQKAAGILGVFILRTSVSRGGSRRCLCGWEAVTFQAARKGAI